MRGKFAIVFASLALAVASAKSYKVNLHETARVGATELKAGEYRVEVVDGKAVLSNGKVDAQATVKVESAESKYSRTSIRMTDNGGTPQIVEIRLGGTNTRLVFTN